ncbi:unnamed protein product [marine sediment metagenome]|uniref:Uncharacterized protein n=1 Tax=marine sediment metagenome TaxID=412755 RepID=X1SF20_9ZZZZ
MKWMIPDLGGVIKVMETISFIQFIEEEAIQSAALGVFLALQAKSHRGAALGVNLLKDELIPHAKILNETVGTLAPYSKGCFADFIKAQETNLEIYQDILFSR